MVEALNLILIGCMLQGALCQFLVTVPQSIEVLTGSCVTIPCTFQIPTEYENNLDRTCRAIWKNKNSNRVVYDSSDRTRINGELRGILTEKDCTTTLNNVAFLTSEYYFRLECLNRLKNDFRNIVKILVKDDPPIPTLTPSTLWRKEETTVRLKCSAPAPCLSQPPTLTWTPSLGEILESEEENEDKNKVKTSVLTFTASHIHHRQEISCNALYSKQSGRTESTTSRSLTLNISFAPQILPPSDCTKTADQLNCSCETVGNPSPSLQWYLDGSPVSHSDKFAISNESRNDTGLRSFITVKLQERDLSTLLCHSSNTLGSASQRFYIYSFQPQTSAESQECLGQVGLPVFIITVGLLTAALVCASLFALRAQRTVCHNPTKSQCSSDTDTAVMSRGLASVKGNKVSITSEEDIYVNTNVVGKSHKSKTHQGHERVASESSEKKNEEGSDVIYSSVIWGSKSKKMKKKQEHSGDRSPSGSSGLEKEMCMEGGMCRNVVSDALETRSLYDNTVAGKDAKEEVYIDYAKVKFKDKNVMHK